MLSGIPYTASPVPNFNYEILSDDGLNPAALNILGPGGALIQQNFQNMADTLSALSYGLSGYSGVVGPTGISGISGYSGYSGVSGSSGTSGVSGASPFNFVLTLMHDGGNAINEPYAGTWVFSGYYNQYPYWVNNGQYCYWVSPYWNLNTHLGGLAINQPQSSDGINFADFYTDSWEATPGLSSIVPFAVAIKGTSGASGYSGYSGTSGASGLSGKSGYGTSGASGLSGKSGYGASGASGYSGYSGTSGASGRSGFSGYGYSGFSGFSGFSGASSPAVAGIPGTYIYYVAATPGGATNVALTFQGGILASIS